MQYPYVKIAGSLMPYLLVTLKRDGIERDIEALVDSGSTLNIFDAEFAVLLGIDDLSENAIEVPIAGVTGEERTGYVHEIVVCFSGRCISTPVAFMKEMPDSCKAILGQEGFFDRVNSVRFRNPKKVFEITISSS